MFMNPRVLLRRFGRTIAAVMLAIGVSVGAFRLLSDYFTITAIEVVDPYIDIEVNHDRFQNNILLFSPNDMQEDILRTHPLLEDVHVTKVYPHTIQIDVVPRVPIARIQTATQYMLIDHEGYVLGNVREDSDMPLVVLPIADMRIGQRVADQRVQQSVYFLRLVGDDIEVEHISEHDATSLRAEVGETDIFFPQNGLLEAKVSTLQILLSGFRIKGTLPDIVDLRYSKPTVKI